MKQLPIVVLKGYSHVAASLCRLCVPNAFDGRAGFDLKASHLFLWCVLAAITLVSEAGGLEMKGLELTLSVWLDFLSAHCPPVSGGIWSQVAGTIALRVGLKLALFPLNIYFSSP